MRSRILFLPAFDRIEELQYSLACAAFYLAHAEPERLTFLVGSIPIDEAKHLLEEFAMPDDFDSGNNKLVARIAERIRFVSESSQDDPLSLATHDIIAVWDSAAFDASPWVVERGTREEGRTIFGIDNKDTSSGATAFALMANTIKPSRPSVENQRFDKMVRSLPASSQSYLFGADPSLRDALDRDFSDGIRIVYSAVVLDDEIMNHVRPHIAAIADPVLDLGPSVDAEALRVGLRRRLAIDPALHAVVPLPFRSLLVSMMPEHEPRLVGIPLLPAGSGLSIDLRSRFGVLPFPNAVTMLMLPIAASISERIGLVGFDGGDPVSDYQRSDEASASVDEDGLAVRQLDPDLPNTGDDDSYEAYTASLVSIVQACEALGIVVESISRSHIRPLARRYDVLRHHSVDWKAPDLDEGSSTVLVSIDPDWDGDFGHYGPWFRTLAAECEGRGVSAVSLASRAVTASNAFVLPTFSYPTTNRLAATTYAPQFEIELISAVDRLLTAYPDRRLTLFFYCADVWHLPSLIRLLANTEGRVDVHVNLMRTHPFLIETASDSSDSIDPRRRALGGLLDCADKAGIEVTVDTEQLRDLVRDLCGVEVGVIPMAAAAEVSNLERSPSDKLLVYCPALSQVAKGAIDFARAAASLAASDLSTRARFRMRLVRQPGGLPDNLVREVEMAEDAGVEVIRDTMTDAAYSQVIEEADIIVVPYRATVFRTRTSAAIVDAIRAGKPVVAASGTWGDSVLQSTGSAVSFRSGDNDDLARAITEAVNRFDQLSARARTAAIEARDRYSIVALVDHVLATHDRQPTTDPSSSPSRVADLEAVLESHVRGLQDGRRSVRAAVMTAHDVAVRERNRATDLTDRNGELTRAAQVAELRNRELVAKNKDVMLASTTTKRDLETAIRDLEELARDREMLQSDRETAIRDLEELARDHEMLQSDRETATRDLDEAHQLLQKAKLDLEAASARELRTSRQVETLSHSVEILEGRLANRAFAAIKRVVKR